MPVQLGEGVLDRLEIWKTGACALGHIAALPSSGDGLCDVVPGIALSSSASFDDAENGRICMGAFIGSGSLG